MTIFVPENQILDSDMSKSVKSLITFFEHQYSHYEYSLPFYFIKTNKFSYKNVATMLSLSYISYELTETELEIACDWVWNFS